MSSFREPKRFPWKWLICGIVLLFVLVLACCDFQPKSETVQVRIQHTVD